MASTVWMWSKRKYVLSLPFVLHVGQLPLSVSFSLPLFFLSLVHSLSSHHAQNAENYYRCVNVLTNVNKAHTHSQTTLNCNIFFFSDDNSLNCYTLSHVYIQKLHTTTKMYCSGPGCWLENTAYETENILYIGVLNIIIKKQ